MTKHHDMYVDIPRHQERRLSPSIPWIETRQASAIGILIVAAGLAVVIWVGFW